VGAAVAYVVAPEVSSPSLADLEDLRDRLPLPRARPQGPLPPRDEALGQLAEQSLQELLTAVPGREREELLRAQVAASGLPVAGLAIQSSPRGSVAVVGVSYERLGGGMLGAGAGLKEGLQALLSLARDQSVDLSGVHDLTVAVSDQQGRVLFGVSAPVSAVEQYRAGQISDTQFAQTIGFKSESRLGVLDSIRKMFTSS
jgi:hypothetical protein